MGRNKVACRLFMDILFSVRILSIIRLIQETSFIYQFTCFLFFLMNILFCVMILSIIRVIKKTSFFAQVNCFLFFLSVYCVDIELKIFLNRIFWVILITLKFVTVHRLIGSTILFQIKLYILIAKTLSYIKIYHSYF